MSHSRWCNIRLELGSTHTSMPKMEIRYFWITSASGPANSLHRKNTRKDITGYLAALSYQYTLLARYG